MHFTSHTLLDDGVIEREFRLDAFTGILWMPPTAAPSSPAPLLLLNQPGGFGTRRMYPRLVARARAAAADGFASVTIELPGTGDRPPLPGAAQARVDLRAALAAGEKPSDDVIDRLILPLVDAAVPEWQATLDAVLALPEIGAKVGFSGGVIAVGVRLAVVEPRIAAAGLFAGSYVPHSTMGEARRITIPLHVLLQWDDEGNDRQAALDLFDSFGSIEKTLVANMGGHTGVPAYAGEGAGRFFVRHLGRVGLSPSEALAESVTGRVTLTTARHDAGGDSGEVPSPRAEGDAPAGRCTQDRDLTTRGRNNSAPPVRRPHSSSSTSVSSAAPVHR